MSNTPPIVTAAESKRVAAADPPPVIAAADGEPLIAAAEADAAAEPAIAAADAQPEQPAYTAEQLAFHRRACDWLEYWRGCRAPPCKRAHACAGDPTDCYLRGYVAHSPAARVWIDVGVRALADGLSTRAAARRADVALARYVKTAASLPLHERRPRRP